MIDIVGDARRWLDVRNGRVSTHSENCHQWHPDCLVARLVAEVERHRMTERERAVVAEAADTVEAYDYTYGDSRSAAGQPLRDYLDRTKPKRKEATE